jgi:ech hydrogenase subunit A
MIVVPFAAGLGLLWVRSDRGRGWLVTVSVLLIAGCSLALAGRHYPEELQTHAVAEDAHWVMHGMTLGGVLMAGYIVWIGVRLRRPLIVGLMLAQGLLVLGFEWRNSDQLVVPDNLFVDKLSVILVLINGVVGGAICLYALGYMRAFHLEHHPEVRDRRPLFFGLLLIFLGAMSGVVLSNNLLWLHFFWEVTTLCSFLLIGYKGTEEARANACRALTMNLVGGLAFAVAIWWFFALRGSIELRELVAEPGAAVLGPVALLCVAGLTKSAQLPFSRWLLGAMVAPTPVSALLHSSTMVKAGVYLIVRLAPVMAGSTVGIVVALVGAVTFLVGSFAAIGTSDAKKVLAYSTVANLGLIVLCGGVGTYEALWAGILLIVFHAVAKCLLFLCVGVIEHKLHSRDIESMSGLVLSMPRLSVMMQVGMAGMFLAPFGMLISKWAVLKAVVDAYPVLTVFVVFGSAATLFFWVKWMGKLLEVLRPQPMVEGGIGVGEWAAMYLLSGLTFGTCLLFPLISARLIEPYVAEIYGQSATMGPGNLVIMTIMLVMISLFPLSFIGYGRRVKVLDAYLGGTNAGSSVRYVGGAGQVRDMELKNFYLEALLPEGQLMRWGDGMGIALLVILVGLAFL